MRHLLIKEKEIEVENIIQKVHSQTDSNSNEIVRQHQKLMERVQNDHAEEIQSLQDKLGSATERLVRLQREMSLKEEMEREKVELENELVAKTQANERLVAELARLKVGEEALKEAIRTLLYLSRLDLVSQDVKTGEEFKTNLDNKDNDIKELSQRLLNAETQVKDASKIQAIAVAEVESEKNATLYMLEERVRTTIKLKDDAIDALKVRAEDAEIKAEHLQGLLEQQRKDLLGL